VSFGITRASLIEWTAAALAPCGQPSNPGLRFRPAKAISCSAWKGRARAAEPARRGHESRPDLFAILDSPRPGGLFEYALRSRALNRRLAGPPRFSRPCSRPWGPMWEARPILSGGAARRLLAASRTGRRSSEDAYVPCTNCHNGLPTLLIEPFENAGIFRVRRARSDRSCHGICALRASSEDAQILCVRGRTCGVWHWSLSSTRGLLDERRTV